jgi:hypothetical protein
MFLRGTVYYVQNNQTGEQKSLRTKDEQQARRLLEVHNSTGNAPALNLELFLTSGKRPENGVIFKSARH